MLPRCSLSGPPSSSLLPLPRWLRSANHTSSSLRASSVPAPHAPLRSPLLTRPNFLKQSAANTHFLCPGTLCGSPRQACAAPRHARCSACLARPPLSYSHVNNPAFRQTASPERQAPDHVDSNEKPISVAPASSSLQELWIHFTLLPVSCYSTQTGSDMVLESPANSNNASFLLQCVTYLVCDVGLSPKVL